MGTPEASTYPGLVDLPDWKEGKFETSQAEKMNKIVPKLDPVGIDLLEVRFLEIILILIIRKCLKSILRKDFLQRHVLSMNGLRTFLKNLKKCIKVDHYYEQKKNLQISLKINFKF